MHPAAIAVVAGQRAHVGGRFPEAGAIVVETHSTYQYS